ncbi:MAG: class I SAM-dependent methyltransferase [Bacteroidota bacterium]
MSFFNTEKLTAIEAKQEAQRIAFGPFIFQASKALRDLGILEAIELSGQVGLTLDEIIDKVKLPRYGVRVLVESALGIGLLILQEEKYLLTRTGYFILHDRMTQVNMDFVHEVNYKGFYHFQDAITQGKPAGLKEISEGKNTIYEALSTLPDKIRESWFNFDHFYSDNAFKKVLPMIFKDAPRKIMDVGANTGKWAIQCAKYSEDVQVTMCDLPGQLNVALNNIAQQNISDRVSGYPIDLLDKDTRLPEGNDVIWMSQFLDCFSEDEIIMILKKAADVMTESACLYILETYWDRQKYENAAFCLQQTSLYFTVMANGNSQMYHSALMHDCIDKAGLKIAEEIDNIGISHTLTKCVKK